MDLARYVVEAVIREGRSYREVARAHGVSKSLVAKVLARYRQGGEGAIRPRSRAPHRTPHRTPAELEDRIVEVREVLTEEGLDAGAATIHYHLSQEGIDPQSVSTIWRVLRRRGFVTPQPHKRPKSSWIRFEAMLPNERWQSDVTSWKLSSGREVEIVNFLDDHSRLITASRVLPTATSTRVLQVFRSAVGRWGPPAAVLTTRLRVHGLAPGWGHRHGGGAPAPGDRVSPLPSLPSPDLRQGGAVHQTLKRYLACQPRAHSVAELPRQVDRFVAYYNQVRPHRATGRRPPLAAFGARDKARPSRPAIERLGEVRVRQDRIDKAGLVSLRHSGQLHHIGVGRDHSGRRVTMLVSGLDIRIITQDGELLRRLTLDPRKNYHGTGRPPGPPKGRRLGASKTASTMS